MYKGKSVLAIIPARGGSKGLPGKNIRPLLGKPLVGWTIEQARQSKYIDRVFVSTDSPEISTVSSQFGIEVPFLRPAEIAGDNSPIYETVLHTLDYFKHNLDESFDYVSLLEPTSPLRELSDIDMAVKEMIDHSEALSLVSVGEVHMEHPLIVKKIIDGLVTPYIEGAEKIYQRQQADKAFFPYGVIYISEVKAYGQFKTFYTEKTIPFQIKRWQNYEIDDEIDFMIIENIMKKKMEAANG